MTTLNTPAGDAVELAGLDQALAVSGMLSVSNPETDYATDYNTSFTSAINSGATSTAVISLVPSVAFATTPDGAGINLDETGVDSSSVEISLVDDIYAKPPVDRTATQRGELLRRIGVGVGIGVVKDTNARLVKAIASGAGVSVSLGATATALTAQNLWSKLNAEIAKLTAEQVDVSGYTLNIDAVVWSKLTDNISVLSTAVDAKQRAAEILGVARVRLVTFPDLTEGSDTVRVRATLCHRDGFAQAKRIDDVRLREGDKSDYLFVRVRTGNKVLLADKTIRFTVTGA